jgi:mono/diheme cytochrome c family protein
MDSQDPLIEAQEKAIHRFMEEPFVPDTMGKPPPPAEAEAVATAPESYTMNCAGCHGDAAQGSVGPALTGLGAKPGRTPDDVVGIIRNPEAYGLKGMPAFADMSDADARAIAEWLVAAGRR